MREALIGVTPVASYEERRVLFRALEAVFPVRFRGAFEPGELRGLIAFHENDIASVPAGTPVLLLREGKSETDSRGLVEFGQAPDVDAFLRGREMEEESAGSLSPVAVSDGDVVIASRAGSALWVKRGGSTSVSACSLPELAAGERLRNRLRAGRFLPLTILVHFLREALADLAWCEPAVRACVIIDDPNLHATSYGYLDFREVLRHAEEHDYHLASATIPLDAWLVSPAAAALFRRGASRLSLLVHGNNHVKMELGRPMESAAARSLAAQALRRIEALERRSGVDVARIMVAPHGECSEQMIWELLRVGFHGICLGEGYSWRREAPEQSALADWLPAEPVTGGLPLVTRVPFDVHPDQVVLNAFLRKPLIFYGHHDDFATGLDPLRKVADLTRSLGEVRWCPMGEMFRTNVATRVEGTLLRVRAYSKRFDVRVPEGVNEVVVEMPSSDADMVSQELAWGSSRIPLEARSEYGRWETPRFPLPDGSGVTSIEITHPTQVPAETVASPAWHPWPIVRRLLTEGRDRVLPLTRRA